MPLEDRRDVVSVVEEAHALIGNSLATDVPAFIVVRGEVWQLLQQVIPEPLVEDTEMLARMRQAYFDLIGNVQRLQELLLGAQGESLDAALVRAGLSGQLLAIKVIGFRRELDGVLAQAQRPGRRRWFRRAAKWADIVLGSLSAVPLLGPVVEPLKEFKESVETQVENESEG